MANNSDNKKLTDIVGFRVWVDGKEVETTRINKVHAIIDGCECGSPDCPGISEAGFNNPLAELSEENVMDIILASMTDDDLPN